MPLVQVNEEVADAVAAGVPVVALESTLIAHGLPRPTNLEVARELERIVRAIGAVPATIAVIDGVATVGIDDDGLQRIAMGGDVRKVSTHDLPAAAVHRTDGATTVASTAALAAHAGIDLFATGGLGGVHREAGETWDVSADLAALAHTPVGIVCAGVKSILDMRATRERLETLGVTVVGYRTHRFPGFYLTDSGLDLEWRVDDPAEAAGLLRARADLALSDAAVVVCNPVAPESQLDPELHDRALAEALAAVEVQGVRGSAVTPFLLEHLHRVTGGDSLRVNIEVVRGNADLAARIAVALARGAR